jgi:hypothetical protein
MAKSDDDRLVICALAHTFGNDIDVPVSVIRTGMRLRASHPASVANPHFFVPDGTPDDEFPSFDSFVVHAGTQTEPANEPTTTSSRLRGLRNSGD